MSGRKLIDQVAAKDTELLDWQETDVISITAHPFGWEIWWEGADGEPATPDPVLFRTECMREALARAKACQDGAPIPVTVHLSEIQREFETAGRVEDAVED